MKKLLSAILVVALLVSMLSVTAFADDSVTITVGEGKQFATLAEAFADVQERDYGDITYEIYGKHVLDNPLDDATTDACVFKAKKFTTTKSLVIFKGMDAEAEIFINDPQIHAASNNGGTAHINVFGFADVIFENLTLGHNKNTGNTEIGDPFDRTFQFWYVLSADNQTYKNCKFNASIICDNKNAVFEDCTFINTTPSRYALFYRGNGMGSALTIEGCTFEGTRAVKIYTDEAVKDIVTKLTVVNSKFMVTEKAAMDNTGTVNSEAVTTITGNTFRYCKAVNDEVSVGTTAEKIAQDNTFDTTRPDAKYSFYSYAVTYDKKYLSEGDVTASTSVTNKLNEDYSISMITAEYVVAPDGTKKMLQLKKDTKSIGAGQTADFENTLNITETEGHIVKTIIIADDAAEPVGTAAQLSPAATPTEKVVFMGTEKDPDNIIISIYQINLI